jgi:23S rRNA G2445 N2-methylase RlmL
MNNEGNDRIHRMLVTCAKGVAPYLHREIEALGLRALAELPAGVTTEGTFRDAMRLNLHVRTGHRVLLLLRTFEAGDPEKLYKEVQVIPWEDILGNARYVCVNTSIWTPTIRDSRFAALRCKDAIVDRIRGRTGRRPDSGPEQDCAVVFLYWHESTCSVYLDTSGEPLSRRGYRRNPWKAPMQESLAAACLLAAEWDPRTPFLNPMCGSGTLAIEAALIALNRAPGFLRTNFGFMHCTAFNKSAWDSLKEAARAQERPAPGARIIATDVSAAALQAAQQNAEAAGVGQVIEFSACDFAETPVPEGAGLVMLNPAYGERMGAEQDLEAEYRRIGDFFKQRCGGYKGCVFTGNYELAKKVGLRTKRKIHLFNSEIECRLLVFELYTGSVRKAKQVAAG